MSYESGNSPHGVGGASDIGEDLYNVPEARYDVADTHRGGLKRSAKMAAPKLGFQKPTHDSRLYQTYDRVEALSKPQINWDVSRDDRMDKETAGKTMASIVKLYGLKGADPAVLEAFHRAIFFSHTVNGGSVLQPGRAVITIANTKFDYADVVNFLGTNIRRFFRAYADDIKVNNQRILTHDDPGDVVAQEQRALLLQVAAARGMSRFPELCHDSADACLWLNDAEHAALMSSKDGIFASGTNMVDRVRGRAGGSANPGVGSMFEMPTARVNALDGGK